MPSIQILGSRLWRDPYCPPHPAPLPREGRPSTSPGRSHCPTWVHTLVLKGPQPHSTLCLPSWAHTKSLQPPYPTWEAPGRQARPGVPCVRHLVAGQVNGAMALAGSLMNLKNL